MAGVDDLLRWLSKMVSSLTQALVFGLNLVVFYMMNIWETLNT